MQETLPTTNAGLIGALDARAGERMAELQRRSQSAPETAAKRFEELLGTMLVKEMRQALPDGFFGKGPGADVYGGWLDEHLGKSLAENGGLGLRDLILPSLGDATATATADEAEVSEQEDAR